jgi:hypothetical protein
MQGSRRGKTVDPEALARLRRLVADFEDAARRADAAERDCTEARIGPDETRPEAFVAAVELEGCLEIRRTLARAILDAGGRAARADGTLYFVDRWLGGQHGPDGPDLSCFDAPHILAATGQLRLLGERYEAAVRRLAVARQARDAAGVGPHSDHPAAREFLAECRRYEAVEAEFAGAIEDAAGRAVRLGRTTYGIDVAGGGAEHIASVHDRHVIELGPDAEAGRPPA